MYVERLTPPSVTREYPIVFVHGLWQTGINFLETPDGRPGWASYFLEQGYTVYLSDQPSRGRSPWNPSIGSMSTANTGMIERIFTATKKYALWPQAELHTQWPGTGQPGDPTFDAFFASQIQGQTDFLQNEDEVTKAYVALLDKIGAAHVVVHSQAGLFGWRVGDLRPSLVKSLVTIEPAGPPFISYALFKGPQRPYGLTFQELTYEPTAGPNATLIDTVTIPAKDANHSACIMQSEPAKLLTNLAQIPVLLVTGEASYHATHDHCTVAYVRQAGVDIKHLELGEEGIHGNGHMMLMEKNNLEVAEKIHDWIAQQ